MINIFEIDITKYCKFCNPLRLRRSHAECILVDSYGKQYNMSNAMNKIEYYREECEDNCNNKLYRMAQYMKAKNYVNNIKSIFKIPL